MALIEWNEHLYSVKIDQFDDDHKRIVLYINDLHEAMLSGKGKEKLGNILDDLLKYTQSHFSSEEKEMEAVGYLELDAHKKLHQDLISQLNNLIYDYQNGKREVSIATFKFLKEWLFNHIQVADKKYSPWLQNNK